MAGGDTDVWLKRWQAFNDASEQSRDSDAPSAQQVEGAFSFRGEISAAGAFSDEDGF
jgi:hypothetical protein